MAPGTVRRRPQFQGPRGGESAEPWQFMLCHVIILVFSIFCRFVKPFGQVLVLSFNNLDCHWFGTFI
jgi:hypothetical protein